MRSIRRMGTSPAWTPPKTASAPAGLTISEIAQRLGRSISEIFRVVIVMENRRWLRKEPGSDRYSVTYRMLDVAFRDTPAQ